MRAAGAAGAHILRTVSRTLRRMLFFFFLQKSTTDQLREFVLVLNTPGTKSFLKES